MFMKSGVCFANLDLDVNEGIYKKIVAEAKAVSNKLGCCILVMKKGKHCISYLLNSGNVAEVKEHNSDAISYVMQYMNENDVDCIYIRHTIPSIRYINMIKMAHKKGIKLIYEIPTYPYFGEQFKTSKRKYRAVAKIIIDCIFWPIIYYYVDLIPVMRSSTKVHLYKKMISITNGLDITGVEVKSNGQDNRSVFSMVAVGTLFPYHGYDRVLLGMKECNEKIKGVSVHFYVIGESETINELKLEAVSLGLNNVHFLGKKNTDELNKLYFKFDVGLGCLALHRRNADIDTTLKIIEYYCRGIPVVTSGISPMDNILNCTIHVHDDESPINIEEIYDQFRKMSKYRNKEISACARNIFTWNSIISKVIENVLK